MRRDQSTRCDQGSQSRSAGKRTGPAPCGPVPHSGPTNVSETSDGSLGATPCLQMTTVASIVTEVPLVVMPLGAIMQTLDASPGQGLAQTLRGVGPVLTLPLIGRVSSFETRREMQVILYLPGETSRYAAVFVVFQ